MGADFGGVRAYMGPSARQACLALGAEAYAVGPQIAFRHSNPGMPTVAHELTHVVQQRDQQAPALLGRTAVSSPDSPAEREASTIEEAVRSGQPVPAPSAQPSGSAIHRQESQAPQDPAQEQPGDYTPVESEGTADLRASWEELQAQFDLSVEQIGIRWMGVQTLLREPGPTGSTILAVCTDLQDEYLACLQSYNDFLALLRQSPGNDALILEVQEFFSGWTHRYATSISLNRFATDQGTNTEVIRGGDLHTHLNRMFQGAYRVSETLSAMRHVTTPSAGLQEARRLATSLSGIEQMVLTATLRRLPISTFFRNELSGLPAAYRGNSAMAWDALVSTHDQVADLTSARNEHDAELAGLTQENMARLNQLADLVQGALAEFIPHQAAIYDPLMDLRTVAERQAFLDILDEERHIYDQFCERAPAYARYLSAGTSHIAEPVHAAVGLEATVEAAEQIGHDMYTMLPGAACVGAAGFFSGLGEALGELDIPLLPDLFKEAGSNFVDLSKVADEVMEVDMPPELLATRDSIARLTGDINSRIFMSALTQQAGAVGSVLSVADAAGVATDIGPIVENILRVGRFLREPFGKLEALNDTFHAVIGKIVDFVKLASGGITREEMQQFIDEAIQDAAVFLTSEFLLQEGDGRGGRHDRSLNDRSQQRDATARQGERQDEQIDEYVRQESARRALVSVGLSDTLNQAQDALARGDGVAMNAAMAGTESRIEAFAGAYEDAEAQVRREVAQHREEWQRAEATVSGAQETNEDEASIVNRGGRAVLNGVLTVIQETVSEFITASVGELVRWVESGAPQGGLNVRGVVHATLDEFISQIWSGTVDKLVEDEIIKRLQAFLERRNPLAAAAFGAISDACWAEFGDDLRDWLVSTYLRGFFNEFADQAQLEFDGAVRLLSGEPLDQEAAAQ